MEGCPAADGYLSFPPECVGGVAQNAETKVLRRHTFRLRLSSSFRNSFYSVSFLSISPQNKSSADRDGSKGFPNFMTASSR